MSDLILQDSGALTISDSDRIRLSAAWEALSVNSRRSYQGAWDRCGQWLTDRGISLDDLSDELMAAILPRSMLRGEHPPLSRSRSPRSTVEISRTTRSPSDRAKRTNSVR